MARVAQADCAKRVASGSRSRSSAVFWDWRTGCHPDGRCTSAADSTPIYVRDANNMESAITAFARDSNSGMIITSSGASFRNQQSVVALATRLRLPAIYDGRFFVTYGGLLSYGLTGRPIPRCSILRRSNTEGVKACRSARTSADQNRAYHQSKTAKALGLTLPPSVLAALTR